MTESQFLALEGEGTEPPYYSFFVKGSRERELEFISFLKSYHLENDFKLQTGEGLSLFTLDIRNRADFPMLQELFGIAQEDFLR